jgi:hypothetical protein
MAYWGIHALLTSAVDIDEWSASRPGLFTPRERVPGAHWIRGWVGTRAVLDAVVKRRIPSPHRESNPRTPIIQTVTSAEAMSLHSTTKEIEFKRLFDMKMLNHVIV